VSGAFRIAPALPSGDLALLVDSLAYGEGFDPDEQEERVRFALVLDPSRR